MWLFAVLLGLPLIEIALFVTVGGWLTLWPTLAIVLGTGLLGVSLIRRQGLQALGQMRARRPGVNPLALAANDGMVMLAAILLILPGFFTDTLGLLLLIPPLRRALIAAIAARVQVQTMEMRQRTERDIPIDGEYIDLDAQRIDRPGQSDWTRH